MRRAALIPRLMLAALIAGLPAAGRAADPKTDEGGKGGPPAPMQIGEITKPRTVCFYAPPGEGAPQEATPSGEGAAAVPGGEAEAAAEHATAEPASFPATGPAAGALPAAATADAAAPGPKTAPAAETMPGAPPATEPEVDVSLQDAARAPALDMPPPPPSTDIEAAEPAQPRASETPAPPAEQQATPAQQQPAAPQPFMLVRTLETIQDRIAEGSHEAHAYQRQLIADIAEKLPSVSDEDWRQPRNSRAAIVYALSGGDPGVLAKLLSLSPLPCIEDNLIKGLLDYSQGRNKEALELLKTIDARKLDPRAGGHLALAQAMLVAADDPKQALVYLDIARLLSPGTLVEEAALRREAVIAAVTKDFDKFTQLSSQYLRRFSRSVYANDFIRRFASAVVNGQYATDSKLFQDLSLALDSLEPEQQKFAYSAIAEAAVVRANIPLTLTATQKLASHLKDDPKALEKIKLYENAVKLVGEDYEGALAALQSVDRATLGSRDLPLLDAALKLAERLRAPPALTDGGAAPPPVSAEQGKDAELSKLPPVVAKADEAVSKADGLLSGDKR